jgi:hypothetical protein
MTDLTLEREIRQALAELELVSHAATQNLNPTARDTSEEPGGRRPGGSDSDRPNRSASHDERHSWQDSYQRKTVQHFRDRLVKLTSVAELEALREEIRDVVTAWKRAPMPKGQEPLSRADPGWKRYIAECGRDSGDLARQYGVKRRYINKIKAMEWSAQEEKNDAQTGLKLNPSGRWW